MWTLRTLNRGTPGAGLLAPLNVAAYVAWLAAASSPLAHSGGRFLSSAQSVLGFAVLILFLVALCARAALEEYSPSEPMLGGTVVLQAILAPISLWLLNEHLLAVLLVLAAAQLPSLQSRGPAIAALTLSNLALFAWLAQAQKGAVAVQVGLAYVSFQLFAAFVTQSAYAAYESRRELLRANRELQATRALVAEGARVQERLRLSRELHDIAGHKLTALKLQLSLGTRTEAPTASGVLARCLTLADELLTDIRAVVSALREQDTIDLKAALIALNPGVASVSVKFNVEPDAVVSDIAKAAALVRCAQEGLTNALRHGGATEVLVNLSRTQQELVLSVEDNGTGLQSTAGPSGNGLRGLRERLEEFRGVVSLSPRAPRGCVLRAVLPDPRVLPC